MSNQIDITGGARVRGLNGVITGTTGVLNSLPINSPNGIPQLDVNGKILVSQLPNSVMEFLGTWSAATNTPTLVNGTGNAGDVYLCTVAGTVDFGAGPITFQDGDYVVYSGSTWERSSGAMGTVTSVGASITGNAIGLTGSPVTTAGTLAFAFAGTNLQYVNGAGNLTTFPTLITSIGLSMPTAFNVANSPLTANGTIAVTGAGTASQYIRGDGQLATFPTTGGGGSAIYYYLNGSIASSVAGYQQMANTAVVGTGTDFNLVGNGLIAQFLTDVGNPNRILIPSGAWNFEMFFSSSSNGGNEKFYLELVKYNGSTFTTIASTISNPEAITGGTTTDLYVTSMAVPETTLLVTDRLAIRVYIVDNSGARTITLHTEDNNLCQITTTFSAGISSINGLTENTQYFAVGTSGSDFNISSVLDTHTFNIPNASATARGLVTTGTQTFAGSKTFTGLLDFQSSAFFGQGLFLTKNVVPSIFYSGSLSIYSGISTSNNIIISDNTKSSQFILSSTDSKVYTFPDASGTLALTSDLSAYVTLGTAQTITGYKTFDAALELKYNVIPTPSAVGNIGIGSNGLGITITTKPVSTVYNNNLYFASASNNYTFPNATGTIALTSNLSSYVPYTGATSNVNLGTNTLTAGLLKSTGNIQIAKNAIYDKFGLTGLYSSGTMVTYAPTGTSSSFGFLDGDSGFKSVFNFDNTGDRTYTFPAASGTIALTSNLSSYVPYTGATNNVNLGTNTLTAGLVHSTGNIQVAKNILYAKYGKSVAAAGNMTTYAPTGTASAFGFIDGNSGFATEFNFDNADDRSYTFPAASGTIALVGGAGVGTVTSVAALTLGTSGTDLSSTVTNSTTTPVITLNVPTASATNRGALSSSDWSTFNGKQPQLNGTGFVKASGTTISYDNSTYLTTSAAASTYLPLTGGTLNSSDPSYTLRIINTGGGFGLYVQAGETYLQGGAIIQGNTTLSGIASSMLKVNASGVITAAVAGTDYQAALTNPVTGTGTTNYLPKFTGTSTIGNSNLINDASGNLGLGVTPQDWTSAHKVIQFGAVGSIETDNDAVAVSNNRYFNGINRYSANDFASIYVQANGEHSWLTAPSGTAGNPITFTQAMTLTASGKLLLGTTTEDTYKLDVNGTGRFSTDAISQYHTVQDIGNTGDYVLRFKNNAGSQIGYIGRVASDNKTYYNNSNGHSFTGGAATFSSSVTAGGYFYANSTSPNSSGFIPQLGGTGKGWFAAAGTTGDLLNEAATGDLIIRSQLGRILLGTYQSGGSDAYAALTIANNRNVGIGTSSPAYSLHIVSTSSWLKASYASAGDARATELYYTGIKTTATTFQSNNMLITMEGGYTPDGSGSIVFSTGSPTATERMRITSGGVAQIANASGTLGTLVGSERLNVNGGIYAYGDITSGGTITFANNVVNYGGNTNYKGATGSGDVTLSNNGSALLVTGPLQKNYGSSIKFVGNGSSSYDVDFLNAGFTTKTVKVLGSVHLETTDSSFVIPRMTTTQRDALNANNKIAGAMIYNTSVGHFQGYNGSGWTNFW